MPRRKLRFSVTRKITLGLALIIAIGIVSMIMIHRGLDEVEAALQRLAAVQAPINAAAYEMELNVNGMGLAVLKYLATRRPEYRAWAEKDENDFAYYYATYLKLIGTERERALGERIGALHEEFADVGHTMMSRADRQEKLYAAITEHSDQIDYVLDARLQPGLFSAATLQRAGPGAAVASADFEGELAEVGLWVANYHRRPTQAAKRTIMEKLRVMERTLTHLLSFNLTEQQRRHASALRSGTSNVVRYVKDVIALEDEIHLGRERFIELRRSMDSLLDEEMQVLALRGLDEPREQAQAAADEVLVAMNYLVPLFLLAAGIIGFLLVQVIRKPLADLNRGTKAVGDGDLTYRVRPTANDEFGDLANRYNHMVEQLQATTVSRDRLEESEGALRRTVTELRHEIMERERAEQERERLQVELRRSETMSAMGALVAGVAHEVRNPLFGISSTLDAMSARLGEQKDYRRYVDVLQTEVSRLSKLMGDLLTYGRPPAREFAVGSLNAVFTTAVESCSGLAQEAGAAITVRLDPEPVLIRMNQDRLVQAFQNLIDNALQHAPPRTAIAFEASRVDEGGHRWIVCAVSDDGPGFQAEDLPRIFEPFFTRRRGGTGLGLALVQRIVHEHGGEIMAQNRPEGGAVVTVRLPVVDA